MSVQPVAAAGSIQSAIALASNRTGIDFDYLLGQAQVESGLRADARAPTSSARGLYQFIEQSWLAVVKKHGSEHGMGWAAESIRQGANGRYSVADAGMRSAILNLRSNPQAASLMAAEHAADNKAAIEGSIGRSATGTDLYMAHFLGLGGAKTFLKGMERNPDQSGAGLFPAAAAANRGIFYGANGSPRSLSDIYQRFTAKLDRGAAGASDTVGAAATTKNALAELMSVAGAEVVAGSGETESQATRWAQATLDRLNGRAATGPAATLQQQLLRPTPDTARLAYLMLAQMGGN